MKILDFGLARITPTPNSSAETASYIPAETDPGTVLGTVGYMSPEQVRAQEVDARSDIFSLGCVLYEMVSGRRAFARETAAETQTAILREEPPSLAVCGVSAPVCGTAVPVGAAVVVVGVPLAGATCGVVKRYR